MLNYMIGVIEYKEMKNRDVGSQAKGKAGNQARTIWKAGSQCRLRGYIYIYSNIYV